MVSADLSQYLTVRKNSIAGLPVLDLLDCSYGYVMGGPKIFEIREITAGLLAWVNDIGSFWKEYKDGDVINLVSMIMQQYSVGIDDALDIAVFIHNQELKRFELLAEEISDPENLNRQEIEAALKEAQETLSSASLPAEFMAATSKVEKYEALLISLDKLS